MVNLFSLVTWRFDREESKSPNLKHSSLNMTGKTQLLPFTKHFSIFQTFLITFIRTFVALLWKLKFRQWLFFPARADKIKELVSKCLQAREKAYCPYSRFPVGAAILTADGAIVTGKMAPETSLNNWWTFSPPHKFFVLKQKVLLSFCFFFRDV